MTLSHVTMGHVINIASNDVHRFDEVSIIIIITVSLIDLEHDILSFLSGISHSFVCGGVPLVLEDTVEFYGSCWCDITINTDSYCYINYVLQF